MNHQGLRWNVHCVANVALRIRLNLYKRGFKIYDLLVLAPNCSTTVYNVVQYSETIILRVLRISLIIMVK